MGDGGLLSGCCIFLWVVLILFFSFFHLFVCFCVFFLLLVTFWGFFDNLGVVL